MNSKVLKVLKNIIITLLLPVAFYVVFIIATGGRFSNPRILNGILRTAVYPSILCMALSMNMSMKMMDFSVGAVVCLAAILGGNIALQVPEQFCLPVMVVACIAIAMVVNLISGLAYNLFKVPSLVLSIGLCMVYEGLPRVFVSGGLTSTRKMALFSNQPVCFIVLALAFAVYFFIQNYTVQGKNMAIIGANQGVAFRSGISLPKTKLISFLMAGFFVGVSSIIYIGQRSSIAVPSNLSSVSAIFDALMGYFVATFLARYCGLPVGIVVGVLTMRILNTGLVSCGLDASVNQIMTGFFLLLLLVISANQYLPAMLRQRKENAAKANAAFEAASR